MNKPDSTYDVKEPIIPEWLEPFPEPQTIPSGWDLSELLSAPEQVTSQGTAECPED
jgi:hypothetical protein